MQRFSTEESRAVTEAGQCWWRAVGVRVQRINHRCKVNSDVFVRVSEETGVKILSSLA
jgi:hypothetical protein